MAGPPGRIGGDCVSTRSYPATAGAYPPTRLALFYLSIIVQIGVTDNVTRSGIKHLTGFQGAVDGPHVFPLKSH